MNQAAALERSCEAADREFSSAPIDDVVVPCQPRSTTWIDLEVVDDDGVPVVNRRVRITLADGRVLEGTTDADGLFGTDGIEPGACTIEGLDIAQEHSTLLE